MTSNEKKEYVRKHHCSKCLKKMFKNHPKMLDCIFRHNNDEDICFDLKEWKGGSK